MVYHHRLDSILFFCLVLVTAWSALPLVAAEAQKPDPEEEAGRVREAFPSPTNTMADLAWDGRSIWVADWDNGKLFRVDPDGGRIEETVEAPCFRPWGITWHDGYLFVSDPEAGKVHRLDLRTGTAESSIGTPESSPRGLAHDGEALWLADDSVDQLYRLDPSDGTILDFLKSPSPHPGALAFDGRYLWVTDRLKDELYRVDPSTGYVIDIISSPDAYPTGIAWGDDELLVADFEAGQIFRLAPPGGADFTVRDWREAEIRFVHRVRNEGPGLLTKAEINIAVPPDTLENQVLLAPPEFQPSPVRCEDRWGQRIARYVFTDIAPGDEVEVGYSVHFRVGDLAYHIVPESAGTLSEMPSDIARDYLADETRYQMNDPVITEAVRQVIGDEDNAYWVMRRLYQWVLEHLEYMLVGGWDTPPTLIKRGSGSCSEYAFLFISLCRAAGLPARYEAGTAVRNDDASVDDVYHRWVEVYLPNYGWIPVDPSRGDTEWPHEQGRAIGTVSNRLFITTIGGGNSEYLSWNYNSFSHVQFKGKAKVNEVAYAYWRRAKAEGESPVESSAACQIDHGTP